MANRKTVLLVEDDKLYAKTVTKWLKKGGYKVLHSLTGEKAAGIIRKEKDQIDLILMTLTLDNRSDGTKTAREIIKNYNLPLIILVSNKEKEILINTEQISSDGYIVKDSTSAELLDSIKMTLELNNEKKGFRLDENTQPKIGNSAKALNQEEIEERLLKFQNGMERSEDAIFITDRDGKIEYANKSFEAIYGFTPEEVIGKTPRIIKSNLLHPEAYKNFWSRLLSKTSVKGEIQNKTKEGKIIIVDGSNNPILDHSGNIIGFLGIHRDVTKRKGVENSLFESKERFRLMVENSPDMTMIQDKNGSITFISDQSVSVIGHDPEKFIGQSFPEYIHPEDRTKAFEVMLDALTGKEIINFEYRFFGEKGELHWLSHTVRPLIIDGVLEYVFSTVRDVTERKNSEIRLRESEEQMRFLVEGTPYFFFYTQNSEANITYVSPSVKQITGYDVEDWIGQKHWFATDSEINNLARAKTYTHLLGKDEYGAILVEIKHASGEKILLEVYEHPIVRDNKVIGLQGVAHDITKRQKTEKELKQSEERFRAIFEGNSAAIAIIKPDTTITMVNDAYCTLSGYSREEVIGTSWTKQIPPGDLERMKGYNQRRLLNPNDAPAKYEFKFYHKNGEIRQGLMSVSYLPDLQKIIASFSDITETKKNFDDSKYNHSLLDATIESTADGILVIDLNGKVSKSNKKFADLWNIPDSLIESRDDSRLLAYILDQLKDPDAFIKKVEELYANPELQSHDILEFKDGRTFERLSLPQKLGDEIVGRVWNFRDISDRKRIEKGLAESENKYKNLFEKSEDANLIIVNGKFIDCNEATVKMLRYKNKQELLNSHPSELSPELQPDGSNSFEKANDMMNIAMEKGSYRFEWIHKKADGEVFPVEVLLTSIDIDGENKIIHTVWRDITERKKSEQLRDALFEIANAAFLASDMDTLYKKIHEVVSTLIIAKNFYIAIYDEKLQQISFPYFVDEYDPPQEPKKIGKGCTEYVLRKGEALLLDTKKSLDLQQAGEIELIGSSSAVWLGVPLKVAEKTIGVIVVQDYKNENAYDQVAMQFLIYISEQIAQVIERKRNSEEIKNFSNELVRLNQSKDKFFAIVAHDLKNPFQFINSALKLLISEGESLSIEERDSFLSGILSTSTKAYSLLENLLLWSKNQMGKMDFEPERIDLAEEIMISIELLKNSAVLKKITLTNKINPGIDVVADRNMLNTVIRNLISNSIKFTGENGNIEIEAKIIDNFAEVTIVDDGVGIPPEHLSKLFKIDQTISTPGTKNETGSGIGLILCKDFVEKNNGELRVESDSETGTRISFTIPIDRS